MERNMKYVVGFSFAWILLFATAGRWHIVRNEWRPSWLRAMRLKQRPKWKIEFECDLFGNSCIMCCVSRTIWHWKWFFAFDFFSVSVHSNTSILWSNSIELVVQLFRHFERTCSQSDGIIVFFFSCTWIKWNLFEFIRSFEYLHRLKYVKSNSFEIRAYVVCSTTSSSQHVYLILNIYSMCCKNESTSCIHYTFPQLPSHHRIVAAMA